MARLIARLTQTTPNRHGRPPQAVRALALLAIAALLVGSLTPTWAFAAEAESEGEGQGTPPPRLGNPEFDPGGAETVLEGMVAPSSGEEVEEDEAVPPVEPEPAQEVPMPEAPPTTEELPAEESPAGPEAEAAPASPAPAPAPVPGEAEYAPSPTYESSAPPSSQPVQNEAIVAPNAGKDSSHRSASDGRREDASPPEPMGEAPEAPAPEAPEPTPPVLPPTDVGRTGPGRVVTDGSAYTVQPGDCLWSIAKALLPPGADNARIAAEVARLWRLNADRIGTGDPNLLLVGTRLRLG